MKLNEYLLVILSILLILFVFVSSASAADTNETDLLSIDESANLESNLLSIYNNIECNELDNIVFFEMFIPLMCKLMNDNTQC
ncbi:hypothetical protein [uncultured Methanobrevibacter sp.]|uniref:hypothetical protein n=1 Tax=uncultured Methanobrevibacter sp. TaxID=253161 RepID=UPI002600ED65|nr:hypothetical protein [uncultured Methanobrevibacter sp.]